MDMLLAGSMRPLRSARRSIWRRYPRLAETMRPERELVETLHLNDPAAVLIGRIGVVEEAIVGGRGRLTIGGTTWSGARTGSARRGSREDYRS
jgi:membrane protein implicated in regulation of membrane protease activity